MWRALLSGLLGVGAGMLTAGQARADEGLWPLQLVPREAIQQQYGLDLTPQWLTRVREASIRLANCSATFVSAQGLLLTNEHCVRNCLAEHSSRHQDLISEGFLAGTRERELPCSSQVADVLVGTEDVTAAISAATRDLEARAANAERRRTLTRLEQACEQQSRAAAPDAPVRCESVALYGGGRYYLYRYRRYTDLRMVFAPELALAAFGGDPDNFQFPRFNLDVALLRAYDPRGVPAQTPAFLPVDFNGARAGEPVVVVGNPGTTWRGATVAQLLVMRDVELPHVIARDAQLRGRLIEFGRSRATRQRIAQMPLISLENVLKLRRGELDALHETEQLNRLRRAENELRAKFEAQARAGREAPDPFDQIARAADNKRQLWLPYSYIEGGAGFDSLLFSYARTLVRGTEERARPNEERLREYTDGALPRVAQTLRADVPVYADLEELTLSFAIADMRENLGPDYPLVRRLLARDSPETLSARLIGNSRLAEVGYRMQLWNGGKAAVEASRDPMIELARAIDASARALRRRYEDEVEAPVQQATELIARLRFAQSATAYPDANFTLRLNVGRVQGWRENEQTIEPFTQLRGLYARATGYEPFALPPRWLAARQTLNPDTVLNVSTNNDIVGGNSGSPLLDADAHVLGVVFDGNIHSIAGAFWFNPADNRAVAVDTAALLQALRVVYGARSLLAELGAAPN
ncbi:MAG TPA: S46 family peptidase [Steroidobacteraceae bacterium]|nr:S46 family peptidase [Steroidobacteraceae bacterium]